MNFVSSVNTVTRPVTPASANQRKVEALAPDSSARNRHGNEAREIGYTPDSDEQQAYGKEHTGDRSGVQRGGTEQDSGQTGVQTRQSTERQDTAAEQTERDGSAGQRPGTGSAQQLDPAALREIQKLAVRDRQVRAHEAAHLSAAAGLAKGGPQFEFKRGPDGRQYAVGGEVSIDNAKVAGDPRATIAKAQQVRAAALAPADPSAQDRRVAAEASRMEFEARSELSRQAAAARQDGKEAAKASGSEKETVPAKQAETATESPRGPGQPPTDLYTQVGDIQNSRGSVIDIVV